MKKASKLASIPKNMVCPITGNLMRDPHSDPDGNNYDGPTIFEWVARFGTSPVTSLPMAKEDLKPNPVLQQQIAALRASSNVYDDFDSPRKKLHKLMKFTMKAVRGPPTKQPETAPDYDSIVRYRAQRVSQIGGASASASAAPLSLREAAFVKSSSHSRVLDDAASSIASVTVPLLPDSPSSADESRKQDNSEVSLSDSSAVKTPKASKSGKKKKKKKSKDIWLDVDSMSETSASERSDSASQKSSVSHKSATSAKGRGSRVWGEDYRAGPQQTAPLTGPLANHRPSRGFGAIEEGDEGMEDSSVDDEDEEGGLQDDWWRGWAHWMMCGLCSPVQILTEIFYRDHTIRQTIGPAAYSIDAVMCLALFWLLNDSVLSVLSLRVSGFQDWLDADSSVFVRFVTSSYQSAGVSVLLVLLGYTLPSIVFNSVVVDASKQTRFNMYMTYVKGMLPVLSDGLTRVLPSVAVVMLLAVGIGYLSSSDLLKSELSTTCSQYWWTNFAFITNFSPLWVSSNATLAESQSFDASSAKMVIEYADVGVCFPSLWLVSCVVQLCLVALPLVYMFLEYPTAAISATSLLACASIASRVYISAKNPSAQRFAALVYYSPWGRADAFALGLRLFMITHLKLVCPLAAGRKHYNKEVTLMELALWSACGLVPKVINHRDFHYRKRRYTSPGDAENGSVSEFAGLLSSKGKYGKKKKPVRPQSSGLGGEADGGSKSKTPYTLFDELDRQGQRRRSISQGEAVEEAEDDVDDTKSIFSQITSENYKFPSSISYMTRAFDDIDVMDSMTDADRSVYSFNEDTRSSFPISASWLSCLRCFETLFYICILAGCFYWLLFSFSLSDSGGFIRPTWFVLSEWQYRSLSLLIAAVATYLFMLLLLEASIPPLTALMTLDVWHPLSALALACYLTQFLAANLVCTFTFASDGYEWVTTGNDEASGLYVVIYFKCLGLNVLLGLLLCAVVERPVIALVRYSQRTFPGM